YILDNFYKNSPDGLIGNEDCGQMSDWNVLSSMGTYAVTPGEIGWKTTEPYFDEIKINFEDGSSQTITKKTPQAELQNLGFGNVPMLIQKEPQEIVMVPYFKFKNRSFAEEMTVEIKSLNPEDTIFYRYEYPKPTHGEPVGWMKYENPLKISSSLWIVAYIQNSKNYSKPVSAQFYKRPHNYSIQIK